MGSAHSDEGIFADEIVSENMLDDDYAEQLSLMMMSSSSSPGRRRSSYMLRRLTEQHQEQIRQQHASTSTIPDSTVKKLSMMEEEDDHVPINDWKRPVDAAAGKSLLDEQHYPHGDSSKDDELTAATPSQPKKKANSHHINAKKEQEKVMESEEGVASALREYKFLQPYSTAPPAKGGGGRGGYPKRKSTDLLDVPFMTSCPGSDVDDALEDTMSDHETIVFAVPPSAGTTAADDEQREEARMRRAADEDFPESLSSSQGSCSSSSSPDGGRRRRTRRAGSVSFLFAGTAPLGADADASSDPSTKRQTDEVPVVLVTAPPSAASHDDDDDRFGSQESISREIGTEGWDLACHRQPSEALGEQACKQNTTSDVTKPYTNDGGSLVEGPPAVKQPERKGPRAGPKSMRSWRLSMGTVRTQLANMRWAKAAQREGAHNDECDDDGAEHQSAG